MTRVDRRRPAGDTLGPARGISLAVIVALVLWALVIIALARALG